MAQKCINCEDYEKLISFVHDKVKDLLTILNDVPLQRHLVDKARVSARNISEYIEAVRGDHEIN